MTRFGYIRTSRHLQEGVAGMDPFSQELRLRESGVWRDNVYRDIGVSGATGTDQRHGWRRLDGRLSGGDTLVVVRIDRIGQRWLDTLDANAIKALQEFLEGSPLPRPKAVEQSPLSASGTVAFSSENPEVGHGHPGNCDEPGRSITHQPGAGQKSVLFNPLDNQEPVLKRKIRPALMGTIWEQPVPRLPVPGAPDSISQERLQIGYGLWEMLTGPQRGQAHFCIEQSYKRAFVKQVSDSEDAVPIKYEVLLIAANASGGESAISANSSRAQSFSENVSHYLIHSFVIDLLPKSGPA